MTATVAARVVHHATLHLGAPPERVFPLLCPVREHDWLEAWQARVIHSHSGVAEDDCVFVQTDPDGGECLWSVTRYEPEAGVIEFVAVTAGLYVMKLEIALFAEDGGTRAEWHRTLTALSPAGERALETNYAPAATDARAARLERALDHYLRTGTMLRA